MADLLAIISHDRSAPVAVEELATAYESLRGPVTTRETIGSGWAEVCVLDRPRPATVGIGRRGEGWTAWAGSLPDPEAAPSTPLERLDGQFALVRLEDDGLTLRVAADPLGMKPLFVAEAAGRTCVSTSALVLAKHLGSAPSRPGLETFLRTGIQFGRTTPWEGVERLQPGEAVAFTPRGRERGVYWRPDVEAEVRRLPFEQCAEVCVRRSAAAIGERYGGERPWLDLTGGFDTRLLALLAQRGRVGFLANTVGEEDSEDVQLAREIAELRDWPWTRFGLAEDWRELLPARIEEAVAWGDCHLDALSLARVMQGHREKAETESMLLNGGGGEHFRDFPWAHELLAAGRSRKVDFDRLIAWRLLGPLDLTAFREDPTPAAKATLEAELRNRVEPFAGTPNTFQDDLLYALKSSGHFGAYQAAAGAWVHMEIPFYLPSVFATTISAAPRHRNFHRLMREMMRRLDPAVAAVQTETGGPAEPLGLGNLHRFAPYPWRRGKRFAARLRGRVLGAGGSPVASPVHLANAGLIGSLRAQGRLDPQRMRCGELFDPDRLGALLELAASEPAAVDWGLVGRLVTVELALEAAGAGLG